MSVTAEFIGRWVTCCEDDRLMETDAPSKEMHNFIPKQIVVYNYTPPPPLHTTAHNSLFTSDGSLSASCHHRHHLPLQAALVHELKKTHQNTFSQFVSHFHSTITLNSAILEGRIPQRLRELNDNRTSHAGFA
jgi:hypothetical protein